MALASIDMEPSQGYSSPDEGPYTETERILIAYSPPPLGDICVLLIGIRAGSLLIWLHRLESKDVV